MNISKDQFATVEEALRDITKWTKDIDYRRHTKGYYLKLLQNGLEELNFDFVTMTRPYEMTIADTLTMNLPEGTFDIENIWLFSGDWCDVSDPPNVYWKKNYWAPGKGGVVANNKSTNFTDPFHINHLATNPRVTAGGGMSPNNESTRSHLYYFNIQDGQLMLSPSCSQYEKVLIQMGYVNDLNKDPVIPSFIREAVTLWASKRALSLIIDEDPSFMVRLNQVKEDLSGRNHESDGAWYKAEMRVKQLDRKQRKDMLEYYQRMAH